MLRARISLFIAVRLESEREAESVGVFVRVCDSKYERKRDWARDTERERLTDRERLKMTKRDTERDIEREKYREK